MYLIMFCSFYNFYSFSTVFGLWFMAALNFWLVVFLVGKILCRGGSWWLAVARNGSYVVLDLTQPDSE